MAKASTTPPRMAADVVAAAATVAPVEHRSVTEQINRWARLGMQLDRATTASSRRVMAVVAGDAPFTSLTPEERIAAHATIDAEIAERIAAEPFGPAARRAGQVTVSLDEDGHLIEIAPDGSRRRR